MDEGIAGWIARRARRKPGALALVDAATGQRHSYAELDRRVDARAAELAAAGVGAGDRVALLGENSAAYLEWLFATARLGAITVPVNFRLSAGEVAYVLADSGATALVRSAAFAGLADAARGDDEHDVAAVTTVREIGAEPGTGSVTAAEPAGSDPCVIMYTSGTTGRPKGAVLTHDNMLWNAVNMLTAGPGISGTDITIAAAPLFHIGALGLSALPLLYAGGTVVVVGSFDPGAFVALMAEEAVTTQFLVPAMWAAVTKLESLPALPALRWALVGGAPCPVTVIEHFWQRGWVFCEGFGMTELAPAALFLDADEVLEHAGSVGRPFMHVDVRLVGDDGADVAAGEVGELVLRGPTVFAGYWNKPAETAEVLSDSGEHADRGWFRSGDLGFADAEGFVTLVDRKKDMIITGGENVYPIEVEQVLHRHPGIADVAVIGVGDATWGEAVVAVVVASQGGLDADEVIGFARERIAHFKAPRRVEVVDELPRNATGKLLKRVLREQFTGQAASVSR